MANSAKIRRAQRIKRRARVRRNVRGTDERPRLSVFRSLKYTYAQLISDDSNRVLASVDSKRISSAEGSPKGLDAAKAVGEQIAVLAKEKNISSVVFDRNGFIFHGRIRAVAQGARDAGLDF